MHVMAVVFHLHILKVHCSLKCESLNTSEIHVHVGAVIQVAFIISGCMHATYYKALKLSLRLDAVHIYTFYLTFARMHPVVQQMVDEMCEETKEDMKAHTLAS